VGFLSLGFQFLGQVVGDAEHQRLHGSIVIRLLG
jgi:hypothetical protein